MQVTPLSIPAVKLIQPKRFGDHRGYFAETYSTPKFRAAGLDLTFVQDNESMSAEKGTVRGLHFQKPPHAQDKLIRCPQGAILDVALDIRRGSPTYGQHVAHVLSEENGDQMLVPKGFAHAFVTLLPDTMVMYKVTDVYAPDCDAGVLWSDPALGIDWQIDPASAILSEKDGRLPTLEDFQSPFTYDDHPSP